MIWGLRNVCKRYNHGGAIITSTSSKNFFFLTYGYGHKHYVMCIGAKFLFKVTMSKSVMPQNLMAERTDFQNSLEHESV